ncbi:MAG: tetratricopeptide repeat protein [Proteobacteria bacterium]|nr:tetratricopeptide repeat protein [Pseudomonadota bacterium]
MSDFFTELEEDIREERIFTLWQKYGNLVIGMALAIVLGTAGYTLWKYIKHQNQIKGHISFSKSVDLLTQGKKEEALKAFQDLAKGGGGYGKLAQLYEASLLPNPEELYAKISKENARDPALSNLPKILMAGRSSNTYTGMSSLEALSAPNNAWAPLSLELLALADLSKGDEVKAAEQYIRALKEPYLTSNEQIRVGMMLSQIDVPSSLLESLTKGEK